MALPSYSFEEAPLPCPAVGITMTMLMNRLRLSLQDLRPSLCEYAQTNKQTNTHAHTDTHTHTSMQVQFSGIFQRNGIENCSVAACRLAKGMPAPLIWFRHYPLWTKSFYATWLWKVSAYRNPQIKKKCFKWVFPKRKRLVKMHCQF